MTKIDKERNHFEQEAGYKLSDNQIQFCIDAEEYGLEITYTYSGRGMFGKKCPSVTVDNLSDLSTKSKWKWDHMGLQFVMYAQF